MCFYHLFLVAEQNHLLGISLGNSMWQFELDMSHMTKHALAFADLSHVEDRFRVRLVNLPKKKNIHRDLKLAFKGVPGMLDIAPVVSGNEKTRDPVCKGFAFMDFKSQDDAQR